MQDNGSATVVMLGLPGFRVLAVLERDGELEYAVETPARVPGLRVVARLHDPPAGLRAGSACGGSAFGDTPWP